MDKTSFVLFERRQCAALMGGAVVSQIGRATRRFATMLCALTLGMGVPMVLGRGIMKALISVVGVLLIFLTSYELAGAQRGPWEASLNRCAHLYHSRVEGESKYVQASSYAVQALREAGQISNPGERIAAYNAIRLYMERLADKLLHTGHYAWAEYDWRWVLELDRNSIDSSPVTSGQNFMAEAQALQHLAKCCELQGKTAEARQLSQQCGLLQSKPTRETEISLRNWKPGQGRPIAQKRLAAANRQSARQMVSVIDDMNHTEGRSPADFAHANNLLRSNAVDTTGWKVTGIHYRFWKPTNKRETVVDVQSMAGNLEVINEESTFVFDDKGKLDEVWEKVYEPHSHFASMRPQPKLSMVPRTSKEEALAMFLHEVSNKVKLLRIDGAKEAPVVEPVVDLGVYKLDSGRGGTREYALVWRLRTQTGKELGTPEMIINAHSGQEISFDSGIRF